MNIKIITRHFPANYGSILQSIATQKAIEKLGHKSQIIDYIPKNEYGVRGVLSLLKQKKEWNNSALKKFLYVVLRSPGDVIANFKFSRMRKKYLELTPRYNTKEELRENVEPAEIYMTGSDQVWGEIAGGGYDYSYLLDFISEKYPKVAYSASFGKIDFSEEVLLQYKELLSKYKYISLRELDGVNILNQMGIPNLGQVLDPVYMFNSEWWSRFIKKERTDKYVLVYQIHANKDIEEYAKKFAKEKGLKLIRIFPLLHQIFRGGRLAYLPNISQFLSYIKNAEYVVTDSFHGTSFSLIFNTQFINVLAKVNINSRIYSLLKILGIEDRIVTEKFDFSIADRKIEYNAINKKIDDLREKSYYILKTIIEE
ncbi:MAG: polysaccharide pyruvyl transferase family protein [Bacteroidales bacterium]|nr:polysaccharide pyruvyl transferase family protein [Bacteroidales bacterium]MBQ7819839.1 polysaccharide pyruvyl transferase family protein [Bacteroidales bacterium]